MQHLTYFKCFTKDVVWAKLCSHLPLYAFGAWLVWITCNKTYMWCQMLLLSTFVPPRCCPSFSFREVSYVMNFVPTPDNVPHVTELVKSVTLNPLHRKSISLCICLSCRWNMIHTLVLFKVGVESTFHFPLYNCICIFILSVVQWPLVEDQKMPLEAMHCASQPIYTLTSVSFSLELSYAKIYMSSLLMTYQRRDANCIKAEYQREAFGYCCLPFSQGIQFRCVYWYATSLTMTTLF